MLFFNANSNKQLAKITPNVITKQVWFIDNLTMSRHITAVDEAAMAFLMSYDFPGNIRELENIIEHAFVLFRKPVIGLAHLPRDLTNKPVADNAAPADTSPSPLLKAEREVILESLKRNFGSRAATARELGINPSTLWRKMKKFDIEV